MPKEKTPQPKKIIVRIASFFSKVKFLMPALPAGRAWWKKKKARLTTMALKIVSPQSPANL